MKLRLLLPLLILLSCASPEKRLKRLLLKHPHLVSVRVDTLDTTIYVFTESVKVDSVFKETKVFDTLRLTRDKLTIKYVKLPGDSVYLEGECAGDTIIKEVKIPCTTNEVSVSNYLLSPFIKRVGIFIAILLITLLGIRLIVRR